MEYAASYRFGNIFPIFICAIRGFREYWGEILKLQWKIVNFFDGKSGLILFALAAANALTTDEVM